MADDPAFPDAVTARDGSAPKAFVLHHTAGRGTPEGVVNWWRKQGKGLGSQYIMDRNGVVHDVAKEFGYNKFIHINPGYGAGKGVTNGNSVGMEIIAKDDKDVTPQQAAAAAQFIQKNYPTTPLFGHGQVNPHERQSTEGMTALNAAMALRNGATPTATAYAAPESAAAAPALDAINTAAKPGTKLNQPTSVAGALAAPNTAAGGSRADHIRFIVDYAKQIGMDPNQALAIANAEGLNAWSAKNPNAASAVDKIAGKPFSFGDFQLNMRGGVGNEALAQGIDPRDPKQWQLADAYALNRIQAGDMKLWTDPASRAIQRGKTPDMSAMINAANLRTAGDIPTDAVTQAPGPMDPSAQARGSTVNPQPPTGAAVADTTMPEAPWWQKLGKDFFTPGTDPKTGKETDTPAQQMVSAYLNSEKTMKAKEEDQAPQTKMPEAPLAHNVSPLLAQVPQTYGTTISSMQQPLTWGPRPPGASLAGSAGLQATAPPGMGISTPPSLLGLNPRQGLGYGFDPTAVGYGFGGYG